jgi:hypothetical protein
MTPRFRDPERTAALERDGYVVVPGLAADAVSELAAIYQHMLDSIEPSDPYFGCPMTGTNFLGDRALRMRISTRVGEVVGPRVATVLDKHRFVGASFRVKQTGPQSLLCLHQDPTMVDEEREWSMNFFVPLVDTTRDNGALRLIPGSHAYLPKVRSMNLNDRHADRAAEELVETIELLPMRAGDAIFYVNSILHGSGPNVTGTHRPVVLGTVLSEGSPIVLYFRKHEQPTVVERYEVPDDFFAKLENFERDFKERPSNGKKLDEIVDEHILSRDELVALIRAGARGRAQRAV